MPDNDPGGLTHWHRTPALSRLETGKRPVLPGSALASSKDEVKKGANRNDSNCCQSHSVCPRGFHRNLRCPFFPFSIVFQFLKSRRRQLMVSWPTKPRKAPNASRKRVLGTRFALFPHLRTPERIRR